MSEELLDREKEFRQLNEQLDTRAKQLMCQADSLMNAEWRRTTEPHPPEQISSAATPEPQPVPPRPQVPLEQFLQSRLTLLHQDLDALKQKYKSTNQEMKQLETEYDQVQEERNKWKKASELNKEQKERLTNQVTALQSQLQVRDTQIANLKRENDHLAKELKNASSSSTGQDVRLNKALQELERARANLQDARRGEKELRDRHRRDVCDMTAINRKLDKHTTELTSAFRKQLLLIDNLKKQKMYLESAKITDMVEEDFFKILDWKPDKVTPN